VRPEALHPVAVEIPPDEIRQEYTKVALTGVPDATWHFEIAVPKSSRLAPPPPGAPIPGGPMVSIALLNRPQPPADTEVLAQHLLRELDPADWLDLWLESQQFEVLSRKRLPTLGGAVGDVVGQWQADGRQWMGRFFCTKAGPRLALLWFRTAAADYEQLAAGFFLSIAHFHFLDDRFGPLAEQVKWVGNPLPIRWRTAIPVSWKTAEELPTAGVASFQATLTGGGGEENAEPVMLAKLSFAVVAPERMANADEGFRKMYATLREAGIDVHEGVVSEERVPQGYRAAWTSQSAAKINTIAAEARCRILQHPSAWIAALVLSPTRTSAPQLWMQAKRLLDIATMTLEIA
jgi:hypothetical protein